MATHLPTAPAPPVAAPGWSGQQRYPAPPPPPVRVGRRRSLIGLWILAGAAVVVSIAALVLGVIAVAGKPSAVQSAPTTSAAPAAPILFDDAADRPLCEALPSLMRERNEADRVYTALPVGSAERSAAMPAY